MKFRTRLEKTSAASAITIGNFDGFHAGHRKIIETLNETAHREGLLSVVLTFHPHPRLYFQQPIKLINTDTQRRDILRRQPLDYLFLIDFASVVNYPATAFVRDILLDTLHMKVLIVGQDFRCGRNREGDITFLRKQTATMPFRIIQSRTIYCNGCRVASSVIRKKLAAGAIKQANSMLGHPYAIDGIVEKGAGRGKMLGFPTINISTANQILPTGVFHTQTLIGKQSHESVTNIGSAPTFTAGTTAPLKIETHIPGFRQMIYGKRVTIFFIDKIREELRFDSAKSLKNQIRRDISKLNI